jgi:AraC-like DNA-binding protein
MQVILNRAGGYMALDAKPLMRIDALKGVDLIIEKYGGCVEEVFQEFGLSPRLLTSDDAYLPLDTLIEFSEFLEGKFDVSDLGLQLADHQSIDVLGPISLLVHHQRTVADAYDMIQRYLPYHTSAASLSITDGPRAGFCQLHYDLQVSAGISERSAIEQSFLNSIKINTLLAPDFISEFEVEFKHQPAMPLQDYHQYFQCKLSFGCKENRVVFPASLLQQPLQSSNPQLSSLAEKHVANLIETHPLDTAWQVESLVTEQLPTGACGIKQIASQLNLHERTLQRRLDKQNVFFEEIVDGVRQQQVKKYLLHEGLSLTQVAGLLGYGDQSAFARACKRWTQMTPKIYREQLLRLRDQSMLN